ncbi:hypothetical protein BC833DRAFT_610849 [Globomyces pollinis-pini]|nr:hypothetical protein BC833DRAFT_610849 [Globomyces pollinis-pini]
MSYLYVRVPSFTAPVNAVQASRSLIIYNLNIGGVRKWLTHSIKSNETKAPTISPTKKKVEVTQQATNTKSLYMRSMNPSVPPAEQKEYSRYVQQFIPAKVELNNSNSDTSLPDIETTANHPDFELFKNYSLGKINPPEFVLDSKDEQTYQSFVHVSGSTEAYVGLGARSNDISRFEGYHHWFETGVYVQPVGSKRAR